MTSRIKQAREPPLLSPPGEDLSWAHASPQDVILMRATLEESRKAEEGETIGWMHYYMKELGFAESVTASDSLAIKNSLQKVRQKNDKSDGWSIADFHVMIKGIGLSEPITEWDGEAIRYRLGYDRSITENGLQIAHMHGRMRRLGMGEEVTGKDVRMIKDAMEGSRQEGGYHIAWMHHLMKELGAGEGITPSDMKAMRRELERARHEKDGGKTAHMLYHLNAILPATEGNHQGTQQMPPLRKFAPRR
jgi:hypothetical protein